MNKRYKAVAVVLFIFFTQGFLFADEKSSHLGETKKEVQAEGACAIVGMSAEQCQLTALQRARAAAIEKAAGVSVTSSTLVTNFAVAADFIKTYSRGFITSEKVTWLPLGQYQKDASVAPIPEYRVKITADVYIPKKATKSVGLKARLKSTVFRSGENATLLVKTNRHAKYAVFNFMANDRVSLLFPNIHETNNVLLSKKEIVFPAKDAKIELEMQTLPGHQRDAEAFFIIAWDGAADIRIMELFPDTDSMEFSDFFRRLSEIADRMEDAILPYEVVAGK